MSKRRSFGTIRKLPSGNFQAKYIGADGQYLKAPFTFVRKTDAQHWLTVQQHALITGTWQNPSHVEDEAISVPFGEYAQRHIAIQTNSRGNGLRKSTKSLYRRLLRVNLAEFHGVPLNEITAVEISDWWAKTCVGGKHTTASKAYKLMSSVCNRAIDEGLLATNPCKVRGAHSAITGIEVIVPTIDDIERVAAAINPRFYEFVKFGAYSGLRFGESTALTRADLIRIENEGRPYYQVEVNKAVTLVDGVHIVDDPKSVKSKRVIPTSPKITELLDDLLSTRVGTSPSSLVFPSASGRHLRHDVFTAAWKRALKKSGVKPFTPHGLRHFAGTAFASTGANIAELKDWLGDSSTSAVMRYVHDTGRAHHLVEKM